MKSLIFTIFIFFSVIIYSSCNKPDYSNPAIPKRHEVYQQVRQQMNDISKGIGLPDSVETLNRPTAVYVNYIYNEYDDELINRINSVMSNQKWVEIKIDNTEYQKFLAVYCKNEFRVDVFTMPNQSGLNVSLNWDGWVKICEKSMG
ncbi:hypothetical protein SAMN02745664_101310 [Moraxella cuniculi DSM 21768]|uniref:Uncharacterized protein n=1 Tax=Moraxella cuniculi DSM 21768 TaxID=1122245 RepID=A0A1N7DJ61_9GAMM|nr:hypothetical protein [Moraxella cuniculi]OOS08101.1 hypothetical protein B0189_01860 [Moraxella cuniculi]SIR75899.1 hypothetical protein SAMN02745664_101310 [Moraxella cuniculi DSM 21768]